MLSNNSRTSINQFGHGEVGREPTGLGLETQSSAPDIVHAGTRNGKRRRTITENFAPRKRAAEACQFCRVRKTKCDNVRPTCGFCRHHSAQCVYADGSDVGENRAHITGHQELVERLDEIKLLLLQAGSSRVRPIIPGSPGTSAVSARTSPTVGASVPVSGLDPHSTNERPSELGDRREPYATTRCESLLRWPVFRGVIPEDQSKIESFLFEYDAEHCEPTIGAGEVGSPFYERPSTGRHFALQGIQERDFVPLCKKFLAHVYLRNPILDAEELLAYAKNAAEYGLMWDAPSCLVLLACALASYTRPWTPPCDGAPGLSDVPSPDPSVEDTAAAETYYLAAKKRIGLLQSSIIDIQCFFFASIYEKYSLRPLQAWFYIQQASLRLQAYLLRRGRRQIMSETSGQLHHLEQRLFWSCSKGECELVPEIGLRRSGLEDMTYPALFPSPPETLSKPHANDSQAEGSLDEERGWFFYLAEISVRRTIHDSLWLLYRNGEEHWIRNIHLVIKNYAEFEEQISLWHSHLPSSVRFDYSQPAENEFSFHLQGRFLTWREYILRPLLYYVLNRPPDHPDLPQALALAQESISVCSDIINHDSHHGRHGGTWFVARRSFTCALLLLATVLEDGKLQPPQNWPSLVSLALRTLARWAVEAADVEAMRSVLEQVSGEVCRRKGFKG